MMWRELSMEQNRTRTDYPEMEIGEIAAESLKTKLKNPQKANLTTIVLKQSLVIELHNREDSIDLKITVRKYEKLKGDSSCNVVFA